MRVILSRLDQVLLKSLYAIIIVTSLAIVSLVLFLIFTRMVGWSIVGMLELATISAMWLYMSGAILAARNREHLVVDFLAQRLQNPKVIAIHDMTIAIIMVALGLFFVSLANDMLAFSMKRPQTTPALSLPLIIPQSAIIAGAVFMAIYAIRDLFRAGSLFFDKPQSEGS